MSLAANQRPQLVRSMGVHGLGHVKLELMDEMDLPIPLCHDAAQIQRLVELEGARVGADRALKHFGIRRVLVKFTPP
eukprot:scaffold178035_cov59-Attheya_sp.AAC.1